MCAPIWVQDRDSEESGKEVALMAVVWGGENMIGGFG